MRDTSTIYSFKDINDLVTRIGILYSWKFPHAVLDKKLTAGKKLQADFAEIQFYTTNSIDFADSTKMQIESTLDFKRRTEIGLEDRIAVLTNILQIIESDLNNPEIIMLVCPEDFFRGAEISTDTEESESRGKCMDRDTVFNFFNTRMVTLSAKYPNVIIIPGSVYVSTDSLGDDHTFFYRGGTKKSTKIGKSSIYVQNIAPVFYNGKWVRLIKKGAPLVADRLKNGKVINQEHLLDEKTFLKKTDKGINTKVFIEEYGEDTLCDLNKNLIFMGETPLPNEGTLLTSYGIKNLWEFTSTVLSLPITQNKLLNIGIEICHDHNIMKKLKRRFNGIELDCHIIITHGTAFDDSSVLTRNGYGIRAESDPPSSASPGSQVFSYVNDFRIPFEIIHEKILVIGSSTFIFKTAPLPVPLVRNPIIFPSAQDMLSACFELIATISTTVPSRANKKQVDICRNDLTLLSTELEHGIFSPHHQNKIFQTYEKLCKICQSPKDKDVKVLSTESNGSEYPKVPDKISLLGQMDENSIAIMGYCAYLYPKAIPEQLLSALLSSKTNIAFSLDILQNQRLLAYDQNTHAYSISPDLQQEIRNHHVAVLKFDEKDMVLSLYIFPIANLLYTELQKLYADYDRVHLLQRHAHLILRYLEDFNESTHRFIIDEHRTNLLTAIGHCFLSANPENAYDTFYQVCLVQKKIYGLMHLKVAESYVNLATASEKLKKFPQAISHYTTALAIFTEIGKKEEILFMQSKIAALATTKNKEEKERKTREINPVEAATTSKIDSPTKQLATTVTNNPNTFNFNTSSAPSSQIEVSPSESVHQTVSA
ncbi:MAG TPA: tetratricopeptide repeat protein [Patescibacteria group bacterium]|nr:tetratricopeptide repeat protein [Patescibacteria group bacterium]